MPRRRTLTDVQVEGHLAVIERQRPETKISRRGAAAEFLGGSRKRRANVTIGVVSTSRRRNERLTGATAEVWSILDEAALASDDATLRARYAALLAEADAKTDSA
jgi:hypothetical protein